MVHHKSLTLFFSPTLLHSSSLHKPLTLTPLTLSKAIKGYTKGGHDDDDTRARSTAEEFKRVAEEKAEALRRTSKEAWNAATESLWEGAKETVEKGEPDPEAAPKQKYKEMGKASEYTGKD